MTDRNDMGCLLDEYDSDRFWAHVNLHGGEAYRDDPLARLGLTNECWTWGRPEVAGYGRFLLHGVTEQAHRVAFRDAGRSLPNELEIDHLCRNLRCVNPDHLEAVTKSVNISRGANAIANRRECRHGHALTEDNIVRRPRGDKVVLACKICLAASRRKSYLRSQAA